MSRRSLHAGFGILALGIASVLLYLALRKYSVAEIGAAVTAIPAGRAAAALGLVALSYLCLTGFDALGVRYAGRRLPYRKVALASFVALSLGNTLGLPPLASGAIRYRFYARWGLSAQDVSKIVLTSSVAVALGQLVLAGVVCELWPERITGWLLLPGPGVRALGGAALAAAAGYPVLAATVRGTVRLGRWRFGLPRPHLALGQLVLGSLDFCLLTAALTELIGAPYPDVASAFSLASFAALVSHVPGGLGVLEYAMVTLLPEAHPLGGVLAFRAIYYLVPLVIGGAVLAGFELRRLRRRLTAARGSAGTRRDAPALPRANSGWMG